MWKFNLNRALQLQVPPGKRKVKRLAWLGVTISYLLTILEALRQFRDQAVKEAKMTCQIMYLEHYLNERYGTGEQIYIGEGHNLGPWLWYGGPPSGEIDFFMVEPDNYLYYGGQISNVNFVVNVPRALESEVQMIAAMVTKFKLKGKYFIIQLY